MVRNGIKHIVNHLQFPFQSRHFVLQGLLSSAHRAELGADVQLGFVHVQHGQGIVTQPPLVSLDLPDRVDGAQQVRLPLEQTAGVYLRQRLPFAADLLVQFVEAPAVLDHVGRLVLQPLPDLDLQDEVVHVLLGAGQLQLPGQDSHHQGRAAGAHHPADHRNAAAAQGVGHDVAVADGEEGDGHHPHGVEEVPVNPGVVGVVVHLAQPQRPGGYEEEGEHEDAQRVVRIQRHHGLEDEAEVEVDAVEGPEALGAGVLVQAAVEHDAA